MRAVFAGLLLTTLTAAGACAETPAAETAPLVVELFTSQGCSSCPPADAFLTDLARTRRDLLPLAFHVTYWDYLGWKDPYSLEAATIRQRAYAATLRADGVYTPQMVVGGVTGFVGSRRTEGLAAIAHTGHPHIPVKLAREGATLIVTAGPGDGAGAGTILLIGFDHQHDTPIGRGENSGQTLVESNIVRSIRPIGTWSGTTLTLREDLPAGEAFAAILQAPDGRIIGAARLAEPSS